MLDSAEGLGTLQSIVVPRKIDYDLVQNVHPKTLIGIWCQRTGSQAVANAFHSAMEPVTFEYGNKDIPIYQKIRNAHTNHDKFFGNGTLFTGGRYIMASQKLLKKIDPTGDMPLATFQGHLVTEQDNYMKPVLTPNNEARAWDLSTILDVLENF